MSNSAEDKRELVVGGLIGGEGVVKIVGADLPYSQEVVAEQLNATDFMYLVDCFNCSVVTELGLKPELDVQSVLGQGDRTLITAVCIGAVRLIQMGKKEELSCHVPKVIELSFKK